MIRMDTEELIRSQPCDGVVLMGGCDKTGPGLIMGALSAGLPMIFFPAGAQLRGHWHGKTLGSGSDAWEYHAGLWCMDRLGWLVRGVGWGRTALPPLTLDVRLALQAEPTRPMPYSTAEAQGHELVRL